MYVIEQCNDSASKIYLIHYKLIDSSFWLGIVYCTCLGVSSYNVLKILLRYFLFFLSKFLFDLDKQCRSRL